VQPLALDSGRKIIDTRKKWAVSVAACAVVSGTAVWSATSAHANTVPAGTVTVVNNASAFDSNNKTINTKCAVGSHVVGGGAQIAGGTGHVILTELRPITVAGGDSYQVTAVEDQTGESGTWSLLTYAYCASGPLTGYEIAASTSSVGSGSFNNSSSTCSGGKKALGSGGRINNGANQVDLQSIGNGGSGSISNSSMAAGLEDRDGFGGNWSVTSFTVCAQPSNVFDFAVVKVLSPNDSSPTKTAVAFCPSGKRATGGGGWSDTPGHVTSITPNNAAPTSVTVVARNTSGAPGNWSATATVFCAS
jgi:hypothetical protein